MSNTNVNVRMPPFLPTVPLPVNMVSTGMMYMYSCSQCDFKTHIEAMFKQHVDSVHLGITTVGNNVIMTNNVATIATTMASVTPTGVIGQPQTVVMAAPATVSTGAGGAAVVSAAVVNTVDQKHKCPKCGFLAPSKNQLTQHKRKFHGKNAFQPAAPQQVQVNVAAGGAPQTVTTGQTATGKKTYTCSSCGYSTTRRDGLSQHYDSVHLKIKNHQCDLCPYAASQKGTLNRHVKLRHKKKDVVTTVGVPVSVSAP